MTFAPPTSFAAQSWAQLRIALERRRRALAQPWPQRAMLVGATGFVFWDVTWGGVARNDHVLYLHHISQYDTLWDILSHSPSWNRDLPYTGSDAILYRPVLYLLM